MGVIQRQGIKNTIISYSGILLAFVSLIIIQPRLMRAEEIGLMRIIINFSSLVAVFMPLGIGSVLSRYFPLFRNKHNGHNGAIGLAILFLTIGLLLVGTILLASKTQIAHQYQKESGLFVVYFYYVIPLSFIIAANSVMTIFCNSLFKSTIPNFLNDFLLRLLIMLIIVLHYFKLINLDGFIFCLVGTYGIQFFILLMYLIHIGKPSLKINWSILANNQPRKIFGYGFLLVFVSLSILGLKFIDTVIMAKYLSLELVGIYVIASFIPTIMETPLSALEKISTSKLSQALADHSLDEVQEIYYKSVRYMLLIGGLLFVGINTNISFLMDLLPPKFHGGVEVVYIYSMGTLLYISAGMSNQIIFLSDSFYKGSLLMIGLVIFTVVCNVIFIPRLGINGAALSIALTSLISTVLRFYILWSKYKLQPYDRITVFTILLIAFCFGVNYFIPALASPIINMLLRGSLFSLFYIGAVYYFNMAPELFDIVLNFRSKMKR